MRCESRFSGVPTFLRPDKLELLSSVVDKTPALVPLETRLEGEETFETDFLNELLLPVLSIDEEAILFEETEEIEDLNEVLRLNSCLLASELVDVVSALETGEGEEGNDLCVFGMLVLFAGLAPREGIELLRISGRDFLRGSEAKELVFLPTAELTPLPGRFVSEIVCFSGRPPVLIPNCARHCS